MRLYHEISSDSLKGTLRKGLKRTSRGEKGDDESIIKTDRYLDSVRPTALKKLDLSRSNNIYIRFHRKQGHDNRYYGWSHYGTTGIYDRS